MRRLRRHPDTFTPTFGPTSGGLSGVIGILGGLALAVGVLGDSHRADNLPWFFGGLLIAAICWAMLLRPRIRLTKDALELRNALSSHEVPYALITDLDVRQVTVVHVGRRKYVGLAVGRSRRAMTKHQRGVSACADGTSGRDLTRAGEAELLELSVDERRRQSHDVGPRTVRRIWAVPEIVVIAVCAIACAVTVLV